MSEFCAYVTEYTFKGSRDEVDVINAANQAPSVKLGQRHTVRAANLSALLFKLEGDYREVDQRLADTMNGEVFLLARATGWRSGKKYIWDSDDHNKKATVVDDPEETIFMSADIVKL